MSSVFSESLVAALLLALLHAGAARLRFLDRIPRSRWLSAAGGVALAYVFVHLLPELAAIQSEVKGSGLLGGLERHAYLVALMGIATFYVLEQLARRSGTSDRSTREVGWLHISSYTVYNAIIGYVLVERADTAAASLWSFAFAMGVHFLVNDHGLRQHHADLYHRWGRWLVAGAIVAGWGVGQIVTLEHTAYGLPLAFIAGGVILNVLKEELPEERRSRPLPFLVATAGYTAVLLLV